MTFADLKSGDAVFVDANILIYHFTNHPKYGVSCTDLLADSSLLFLGSERGTRSYQPLTHPG